MAVTSAAGRIITAGAPVHWLLGPIGSNVNQCSIAPRSMTAYRDGVQRQRSYPTIPLSHFRGTVSWDIGKMAESAGVPTAGGPVDNGRETFDRDLQGGDPDDGVVAAVEPVEPVDSDEDESEEEENDNRESVIQQYFQ
ncbi:hypothetical protein NDU88_002961 [Pleurodeles waltl]|uniref:Uncharacterized protein n=1 Tax=Pleurodeles waltl TaxID=8319 RepID=A0AAV7WR02_PLEWA|nr:hypothetical protein NDU88_002961 [Pleurodeles waltl]